jgi:polyketide biosynthesis enoyl-CoA hydratase PksH
MTQLDAPGCAVVIQGAQGTFCDGLNLERAANHADLDAASAVSSLRVLLERLTTEPRPVFALVEATAKGAGVGIAAAADVVIAGPEASFQLPEVFWGLIPAAVLPFVAERVGWPRARRMAMGEAPLVAREAAECGLVDVVSARPEVELQTRLRRMSKADPTALASIRRLVAHGWPAEDVRATFARLWIETAGPRIRRYLSGELPWDDSLSK